MKIVIAYFADGEEKDLALADAFYKNDTVEGAEYDLGKLERFIKKNSKTEEVEEEDNGPF